MSSPYEVRHEEQRACTSADQVELSAVVTGLAVFTTGVQDERISGEIDDLDVTEKAEEPWNRDDVALDDEAGAVLDEIKRRKEYIGKFYPFEIKQGALAYVPSQTRVYEYCLGIALAPSVTRKPFVKLPRSFERLAAILLEVYSGPGGRSFHIGAPRYRLGGSSFERAVGQLSKHAAKGREWRYDPQPDFLTAIPRTGDEGVDFVVWREAPDRRPGQLYIAGQCACGNDWSTKFHDLTPERLESWLRPVSYLPLMRAFATPFVLSEGNLIAAQRDAGWVLDRLRLCAIAEANAADARLKGVRPFLEQMFDLSRQAA